MAVSDIFEIKRRLSDRAHEVAAMLLPQGRREGHEFRAGSIRGEQGQSLGVHLSGAKAGVWKDFSTGEAGDLIDLWMQAKGLALTEAIEEIRGYLGLKRYEPVRNPKPQYTRPAKPKCHHPQAAVKDYLSVDRCIPGDVLTRYKVAEDGNRIVFPFLLPSGELALCKTREAVDGAKPMPTAANCEAILFGWQAIPPNVRDIVLTEGEIDALTMAAYGHHAMSVPFGGGGKGKQNWIENEYERMERFERIFLAMDMDGQGDEAAVEIASRLGRHRCYRVTLPRKDANECLVAGVPPEEIARCLTEAQSLDPDELKRASAYSDKVVRLFWPERGEEVGYSLPYSALYRRILFRPGEFTLWSGDTGSGKSQLISDAVPKWIQEGSRVCLASFEMKPERTLKRMVKQTGGVERPTEPFLREVMVYLDAGLLLYERVGKSDVGELLEIFDYARAKYGCDQFVIDSLMRLGIESDDYSAQEKAVYRLVDWTVEHNVHTHLVAHSRKPDKDRGVPETADIKGAMEIGANAFNIITIWRNRKLEHPADMQDRPAFTDDPNVTINVAKQRNGDFEGKVKMFFNLQTYQYFGAADNRRHPRCYIRDSQIDQLREAL